MKHPRVVRLVPIREKGGKKCRLALTESIKDFLFNRQCWENTAGSFVHFFIKKKYS